MASGLKLSQIDDAVALRNHRKKAIELRHAARTGFLKVDIHLGGVKYEPSETVSTDCVRDAIANACTTFIAETDEKLIKLGVEVSS